MLNVPLGPTPEKGPAGIQERLRGTVPWSRLGNPDPTEEAGLGAEGPMISQRCPAWACLDFHTPAFFLFHHQMQAAPRREWLLEGGPRQLRQTLKELGAGGLAVDQLSHSWTASPSWKRSLGSAPLYVPHPTPRRILWESSNPGALATLGVHKYGPLLISTWVLGFFIF